MKVVRISRVRGDFYIGNCCFMDCMATICNYYDEKLSWIFFDCLCIKYMKDSSKYSYANLVLTDNYKRRMQEYCGVEMKYCICKGNIVDGIKESMINGEKLIINFYAFFCPWDGAYHAPNGEKVYRHSFIVEDFSDREKHFVCTDPFYMREEVYITYEEFCLGYISHFSLSKLGSFVQKETDISLANKQISLLGERGYWDDVYLFTYDMLAEIKSLDNHLKKDEKKKYWEGLHSVLAKMKYRCYYFTDYLIMINEIYSMNRYEELVNFSMTIFDLWSIVDSIVLKQVIKEKDICIAVTIQRYLRIEVHASRENTVLLS